jgi:ATP-dependent DNA helicase HFM1/MER3
METDFAKLRMTDVIVTTPEKWDSMTRSAKDSMWQLMKQVTLFIIDEGWYIMHEIRLRVLISQHIFSTAAVHLLNESRGARLEAIVSRMEAVNSHESKSARALPCRIVAVSATVPNLDDVAQWLKVPPQGRCHFSDECRPVPLEIRVLGYPPAKNDFIFDRNLNYKLLGRGGRGACGFV